MSRRSKIWAPASALVLLWGCGYIGDPQPPALNIPMAVTDLRAAETGDRIVVNFTLPALTTEQTVLKQPGRIELRAGPPPEKLDVDSWSGGATEVPVTADKFGALETSFPVGRFAGSRILVALRSAGPSGRFSKWSNLVTLQVVKPLPAPVDVKAESAAGGVELTWRLPEQRPGVVFDVLRKGEREKELLVAGSTDRNSFVDTGAQYGAKYEYAVEATEKAGDSKAVGDRSALVSIVPEDKFPPAVPAGLTVLAGMHSAELNWERVTDRDLAGYRVYRAEGDGAFERISDTLAAPGFSDKGVTSGRKYRYRITSIDGKGNESAPSESVEIAIP